MNAMQLFRKEFLRASMIAAGLMVIGLVLLGIPGAVLLEMPTWLGLAKGIEGDAAWPAAIFVSLIWPMFVPLGIVAKHQLSSRGSRILSTLCLWGTIVAGIVLVVTLVHLVY